MAHGLTHMENRQSHMICGLIHMENSKSHMTCGLIHMEKSKSHMTCGLVHMKNIQSRMTCTQPIAEKPIADGMWICAYQKQPNPARHDWYT